MYLSHFGFTEWPFANTPDPRFVYLSPRHEEALAHLLYGVRERGGFVQLTGEVGTGKTTICRYLLSQVPMGVDIALVLNPMLTPEELLATVCDELGAAYPSEARTRKVFVDVLYRHLLAAHGRGRRTVLIIDEAQNLSAGALEQLRLLTNLETATEKLLQIILIGQPELTALLAQRDLRQVAQRITARYHLLPFSERDTRAYVWRRLQIAGQRISLFEPGALAAVHRASRGVPRLINVVCDRALLGAFAEGKRTVSARTVRRAAREVAGEGVRVGRWRRVAVAAAAAVLAVAAVGAGLAGTWRTSPSEAWRLVAPAAKPVPVPSAPVVAAIAPSVETGAASVVADSAPSSLTAPPPVPALETLLAAAAPSDRQAALKRVLARWGVAPVTGQDPCRVATRSGLECYDGRGSWTAVRRFGIPVALKLLTAGGARHWVAVTLLDNDAVTLDLDDGIHTVPLASVDQLWGGVFALVWRPLPGAARLLGPGVQGPGVAWLSRALSDGDPASGDRGPTVYDEALAASVLAFQRREGLDPDGVAGMETLVRLAVRLDKRAPLLSPAPAAR
jgi:general secretion pathway protein A